MTNKEKTIRKIEFLKVEMKEEQEQYGRNSLHTKLKLKYLEEVLNDLERLETIEKSLDRIAKKLNLENKDINKFTDIILKDLFILDLIKPLIEIIENAKDTAGPRYYIKLRQDVTINDEAKKIIKEWLNNE